MDDSVSGRGPRAGQRGGRRHGSNQSVLTPPTGMPTVPNAQERRDDPSGVTIPAQRRAPSVPPAPPMRPVVVDPCMCGHAKDAHEHYRAGDDCGVCGATACSTFRPAVRTGLLHRLFRSR
jgi:hypothetical protein